MISRIFLLLFLTRFVFGEPEISDTQKKSAAVTSSSAKQNALPTEENFVASVTVKPQYTFQNSIFSNPYSALKYSNPSLPPSTPTYQSDFKPLSIQSGPTPVIMQYLPQSLGQPGGVQYLQLIPTRPLIVPISPYISQMMQSPHANNYLSQHNQGPIPSGSAQSATTYPRSLYSPGSLIAGYASNQNYYFKPNSGMEIITGPQDLTLNMNEYFPSPNEAPVLNRVVRGRP